MESELQRLLHRIDFMFNTYMRENVLRRSVELWCEFVRGFVEPKGERIWRINDYPMLILNLEVNLNFKKKKEKTTKHHKQSTTQQLEEDEQAIKYEPSEQQVLSMMMRPLEWLVDSVNSFYRLEKDLVPLVDIEKGRAYEISLEDEHIKRGM